MGNHPDVQAVYPCIHKLDCMQTNGQKVCFIYHDAFTDWQTYGYMYRLSGAHAHFLPTCFDIVWMSQTQIEGTWSTSSHMLQIVKVKWLKSYFSQLIWWLWFDNIFISFNGNILQKWKLDNTITIIRRCKFLSKDTCRYITCVLNRDRSNILSTEQWLAAATEFIFSWKINKPKICQGSAYTMAFPDRGMLHHVLKAMYIFYRSSN